MRTKITKGYLTQFDYIDFSKDNKKDTYDLQVETIKQMKRDCLNWIQHPEQKQN